MQDQRGIFIIKHDRIIHAKQVPYCSEDFDGSHTFVCCRDENDKIILKEKKKHNTQQNASPVNNISDLYIDSEPCLSEQASAGNRYASDELQKKQRIYKLNKTKLSDRINAFFTLKESKKLINFVTISFPCGLADDYCYQGLNIWLTKLRDKYALKDYVWIAERQQNGTIHYHMFINQYISIRHINQEMAVTINNIIINNNLSTIKFHKNQYNGVDLKRVKNNCQSVRRYVLKYVSKNNSEFTHLCWFSSRSVSSLFTCITTSFYADIEALLSSDNYVRKTYSNDFCDIIYLNEKFSTKFNNILSIINDYVSDLL
jgi:hypothetical protein